MTLGLRSGCRPLRKREGKLQYKLQLGVNIRCAGATEPWSLWIVVGERFWRKSEMTLTDPAFRIG